MNDSSPLRHADVEVLVVGAGPTGLLLACDLARRGVRVRIVDRALEPFSGSRGKGLQPRTLEVLDDLGIIDDVLAEGMSYPRLLVHLGPFAFSWGMQRKAKASPDVPYPNPWMLPQSHTEAILRRRLTELGVEVEHGKALTMLESDATGATATLQCDATTEILRARYLVGADGGHSVVRKLSRIPFSGASGELAAAIVGDVLVDGLDRGHWHVWPRAKWGPVALCPLPGADMFQLFAQTKGVAMPALEVRAVEDFVRRSTRQRSLEIRAARWLSSYRANVRLADRYREGRVFLAGDAAHVHPPSGGQGLNAGVQDAYNLGWKLGAVLGGVDDALLDTYEEERRAVAAEILGLSTSLYRTMSLRRPRSTNQLGTSYRGSAIAVETRASPRGLVAGDRAPDAHGEDEQGRPARLFDRLRGPEATLLAFGFDAERLAKECARRREVKIANVRASRADSRTSCFVDGSRRLARAYGVADDAIVVVRPDGYVGFVSSPASATALDDYLARIAPARNARIDGG